MLSWSTAQELNNAYFIIQKSTNGIDYKTVGEVKGAGNSVEEQNYRYLDISTGEQKVFYLIKQIDFDGDAGQTHTVMLSREHTNNFMVTSMSSTITDKIFTLTLRSEVTDSFEYKVLDMNSRVLKNGSAEIVKGANMVSIDLEGLNNGKLKIEMTVNEEMEQLLIKKVDSSKVPKIDYVVKEQ